MSSLVWTQSQSSSEAAQVMFAPLYEFKAPSH